MEPLEKKENLADSLHTKSLPSLRTYQGDIATFIKSKDQSLADVALKNREEKEKIKEKQPEAEERERKSTSPSLLISSLSVLLILGTLGVAGYLISNQIKNSPVKIEEVGGDFIIRPDSSNSVIDGSSLTSQTLAASVSSIKARKENGINAIKISDPTSKTQITAQQFVSKLGWRIPSPLVRTLHSSFMVGIYGGQTSEFFLLLQVKDYGIAFRDMLLWETEMFTDLKPLLNASEEGDTYSGYKFKDLIVKNKDTRSFTSATGKTVLLYTFINQNTILITESENSLNSILNTYITRTTVR